MKQGKDLLPSDYRKKSWKNTLKINSSDDILKRDISNIDKIFLNIYI